ncbi:inositol monophosphatase [Deinococcus metallilatus]|uniref:Inositol-1-monophosphatase n=1 Tax=Deinococcus metallilatus TaxID=1211322 RepID=A0AAJ5JYS6_9DEIO|nr:inositol monophosphatase family protein [Deinococcus metallilatus]MBB5294019.1 myo-inositol-1(or 4)-monophosphatase [Deinococcus metallilatus]QBY08811.1 inositol monophosphatase [Deinococcus metallilatus]RXJ09955.1 inositol monophosphatase [Deinococcus metallilatus]TLK28108.1 inositol monophosphatase [Deinococcus metallilatus]GMA16648.1 inositol monophosphatase [Deinococcus metallilatus]
MIDLQQAWTVAVEAARTAGEIHLAHLGKALNIRSKTTPSDLVTEVDALAEAAIRTVIARTYPDHAVLGEEEGLGRGPADVPCRWIVDPLDGTVNYAHGFPFFCASVALEVDGERVVGAVFDPTRQELFTARRGGGADLNGQPIRVSTTPGLTTPALVSTGFPYDTGGGRNLALVARLLRLGVPVRRPGAAALDLCNVACGRMDAYWELGLKPWDSAAGSLIVQEAGGTVTDAHGSPDPYAEMIVATNGLLHAELLALLREEGA